MGAVVNLSRVVAPSKAQASLSVAVRVRPILRTEQAKSGKRDIMQVIDSKIVVVLDPDECKDYLDQVQNRTKEKRYTFDTAYDTQATNSDVYRGSIAELAAGVSRGLNGTVFAYGSTGSGKTHTMVGTPADPGLMVLSLGQIFKEKAMLADMNEDFTVTCSYLEVYNEVIYDLLVKSSGPLELREDPDQGVCVAGLRRIPVTSPAEIMGLLEDGNHRRKTDSTDANATSSRSHAVLEIMVRRCPRNQYRANVLIGKLTLVDLAGSERAAETNNIGQKLRDGANINRSLLALANCINALGKQQKTGVAYVPYRNSKLTRLLKDSLSGNSRTAMVATISAAHDQYHHSVNTLKYADRAKEIKTHVVQNVGSVERHIADYQNIIDNLQTEVQSLKTRLADRAALSAPGFGSSAILAAAAADPSSPGNSSVPHLPAISTAGSGPVPSSAGAVGSAEADTLAWIDGLAQEINENVEERINLQKALFELEDINVCNKYELQNIENMLRTVNGSAHPDQVAEAAERKALLLEEIEDNNAAAERYRADVAANEASRREIQAKIENAIDANSNVNFLKILSTFRIQAVRLQELKFQMAVRDQIISEQRDVIRNLWAILDASGLSRQQVMDIAREEGIVMQGLESDDAVAATPSMSQPQITGFGSLLTPHGGPNGRFLGGFEAPSDAGPGLPSPIGCMGYSLMGGKARFRYRFWQQYNGGDSPSSNGSRAFSSTAGANPLKALSPPSLFKRPEHKVGAADDDVNSGPAATNAKAAAIPALHSGRAKSDAQGLLPFAFQTASSGSPAAAAAKAGSQQQQQHDGLLVRSNSDISPGRRRHSMNAAAAAEALSVSNDGSNSSTTAAKAHGADSHSKQQQQGSGMSYVAALKRYDLQPNPLGAKASINPMVRRHSSDSITASSTAGPGPSSISQSSTSYNKGSDSRSKGGTQQLSGRQLQGKGGGGHAAANSSNTSSVSLYAASSYKWPGGRHRFKEGGSNSTSGQSGSGLQPESPWQQQHRQQQSSKQAGLLPMSPRPGMLAWQDRPAQPQHAHLHHQQQQTSGAVAALAAAMQVKQQQKQQQLSAVYGAAKLPDRLAKLKNLKRQQPGRSNSASISAEHSQIALMAESSSPSAFSSQTSAAAAPASQQQQQQQQHRPEQGVPTARGGLPAIAEAKSHQQGELRRRQQLQTLSQQQRSPVHVH